MKTHEKVFISAGIFTMLAAFVAVIVALAALDSPKTQAEKIVIAQLEAQQKIMKQKLLAVNPGDFIELNTGEICVVSRIWMNIHRSGNRISFWGPHHGHMSGNYQNGELAIITKRIVQKADLEYPAMAAKFINQ